MNLIRKIPIPISGLILALFSLGNLLQDVHYSLRYLFASIGFVFLVMLILKVVLYPDSIRDDFKNPIIVSSSGTFSMSLMILSTYMTPSMPSIAYTIWIIGLVLHILLIIYFTYHFIIRDFDISTVYPSYWIVFVGITMASITAHFHGIHKMDFLFFTIGFIGMLTSTPVILYREFIYKRIPDMNKPLTCIFTALFSILIVGYVNSAEMISYEFLTALYFLSCMFYIFAIFKLVSFRDLDFYPSFSAFTFPFVISALATKGVQSVVGNNTILNGVLVIESAIALVLVVYVLARYLNFLKNS